MADVMAYSGSRIIENFHPGAATSSPLNVDYRLDKLVSAGVLQGRWLDYGCAEGDYTAALVLKGAASATGFDVIADRVALAKAKYANRSTLEFFTSLSGAVPVADATFDGVFVNEVMEHVFDEAKALQELYRVLKPGGVLAVISPNRFFPFECHGATIGKRELPFPVPVLPWLPQRLGQRFMNARNYWPRELAGLVASQGFDVEPVQFVWPVLEYYKWLPASAIAWYQRRITTFDRTPLVRCFGVSTLVLAKKPKH